jgi:hypothetical protein
MELMRYWAPMGSPRDPTAPFLPPRGLPSQLPGAALRPDEEPALRALVATEAVSAGVRAPDELYVTLEPDVIAADVAPDRRVLVIGLPLLRLLTMRELHHVVAHALRHPAGGRTAAWRRWRPRSSWPSSWRRLRSPRPRAGGVVEAEALRRARTLVPGFESYWSDEVVPVLDDGRRPPVVDGFGRFAAATGLGQARPASSLLADPAGLEDRVMVVLFGAETLAELPPVAWEEVGAAIFAPRARGLATHFAALLAGRTAGELPGAVRELDALAARLHELDPELPPGSDASELALSVLTAGLLCALVDAGWVVEAAPGDPVSCVRGDDERVIPAAVGGQLRDGTLAASVWEERASRLGIAGLALAPAPGPEPGPEPGLEPGPGSPHGPEPAA